MHHNSVRNKNLIDMRACVLKVERVIRPTDVRVKPTTAIAVVDIRMLCALLSFSHCVSYN